MLLSLSHITNFGVVALDGKIGHIETFLMDVTNWRLQYLVIDTGNWVDKKRVLVPPSVIADVGSHDVRLVMLSISKAAVERSPLWDDGPLNLLSTERLFDFKIHATDGTFGKVDDLLIEEESFLARYLVVNTGGFFSRHQVLVSPGWLEGIDEAQKEVFVTYNKETIKQSPDKETLIPMEREFEKRLFDHYGSEAYWRAGDFHNYK